MRILLIRLSSLGDIVLTGLLVRRLRATYPEARLDFLTGEPYLDVLKAMPELDGRYVSIDTVSKNGKSYEVIFDLQNNFRSRWIKASLKAPNLFRFHRERWNRFQRIHFPRMRKSLITPPHVTRQYLALAKPFGVEDDGGRIDLRPLPEWTAKAEALLSEKGVSIGWDMSKPLLLAAPGGRHGTKIWPPEKWIEFLTMAHDQGFSRIALIGSKNDSKISKKLIDELPFKVADFCGLTSTGVLIALISQADRLVCGDSGPMHIAAAVGTPAVAIFGPTVQEFGFAPFTPVSRIVEVKDLICRPCHPHGPEKCPLGHFKCMRDLSPDAVWNASVELTKTNRLAN